MKSKINYLGTVFAILVILLFFTGVANAEKKEKEKINKFQVISSDLEEREIPEIEINERGEVLIWMKLNVTYCDIDDLNKTYYLSPEGSDIRLNYSSVITIINDCQSRDYFELAKFILLGTNLSSGTYDFYRDYYGCPLFMSKIHIKGKLPSAVPSGESEEELNVSLINKLVASVIDFIEFLKAYLGKSEEDIRQLSVVASSWARYGDEWVVEANYTDQRGRPILGDCKLNTDRWGVIDMNYDADKKLYVAKHLAEPVGKMRWTVICY